MPWQRQLLDEPPDGQEQQDEAQRVPGCPAQDGLPRPALRDQDPGREEDRPRIAYQRNQADRRRHPGERLAQGAPQGPAGGAEQVEEDLIAERPCRWVDDVERQGARQRQHVDRHDPREGRRRRARIAVHAGEEAQTDDCQDGHGQHRVDADCPVFEERRRGAGPAQRAGDHEAADAEEQLDPVFWRPQHEIGKRRLQDRYGRKARVDDVKDEHEECKQAARTVHVLVQARLGLPRLHHRG